MQTASFRNLQTQKVWIYGRDDIGNNIKPIVILRKTSNYHCGEPRIAYNYREKRVNYYRQ